MQSCNTISTLYAQALKTSDVVLDINGLCFEAAIFVGDWVFELDIGMSETIIMTSIKQAN